jgi:flagellar basal body rod protein FlgG
MTLSDPSAIRYADDGLYSAPQDTASPMDAPALAQGALEASNVSAGAEMITMMAALREAQAGQRLMGVYDDLLGRAITTFGQG